jgi:uncharacterized protein
MSANLIYADSSALVKLILDEHESDDLRSFLADTDAALVTSALAEVEVSRAVRVADPDLLSECSRLLSSCIRVTVSGAVIRRATALASARLRTLDAIHLATALRADVDTVVVYDGRLAESAEAAGLSIASPGAR